MGKHWARQQIRTNELQDTVDRTMDWIQLNRQVAAGAAAAVAVALVVGGLAVYRNKANREAAWEKLAMAHALAYTGRSDQALSAVNEIADNFSGTGAAQFALVFGGDVLFPQGKYKEAISFYSKAVERADPKTLQPVALNDLAIAQFADGQPAEAAKTAERFLSSFPEHFLAPQVHMTLARSLAAQGQTEAAKAAYQKIALQYPDTSFAAEATARAQAK